MAAREDRKTMTRRVVKPQPRLMAEGRGLVWDGTRPKARRNSGSCAVFPADMKALGDNMTMSCPYGKEGDLLCVKETHWAYGKWVVNGRTKTGLRKWKFQRAAAVAVKFDPPQVCLRSRDKMRPERPCWYKRSALFLRKADARTWLERTETRVERVQEISDEDARAEGVCADDCPGRDCGCNPPYCFGELWDKLHGEGAFEKNEWVWVVEFKRAAGKPDSTATPTMEGGGL